MGAKKISAGQIDENHASSSQIQWVSAKRPFSQTKNGLSGSISLFCRWNPARGLVQNENITFAALFFPPGRLLKFLWTSYWSVEDPQFMYRLFTWGKSGFWRPFLSKLVNFREKKCEKLELRDEKTIFLASRGHFGKKKPRVQPFFSVFLKFQVLLTFSPYFTKKNLWWG